MEKKPQQSCWRRRRRRQRPPVQSDQHWKCHTIWCWWWQRNVRKLQFSESSESNEPTTLKRFVLVAVLQLFQWVGVGTLTTCRQTTTRIEHSLAVHYVCSFRANRSQFSRCHSIWPAFWSLFYCISARATSLNMANAAAPRILSPQVSHLSRGSGGKAPSG